MAGRPGYSRVPVSAGLSPITATAPEEAIINALLAAETMTGADYRRSWAIPHDQVKAILAKYGRLERRP